MQKNKNEKQNIKVL